MMMPLGIARFIVLTETFPSLKYIRKDERFFLSCITYDVDKKHGKPKSQLMAEEISSGNQLFLKRIVRCKRLLLTVDWHPG